MRWSLLHAMSVGGCLLVLVGAQASESSGGGSGLPPRATVHSRVAEEVNAVVVYSRADGWGGATGTMPRSGVGMEVYSTLAGARGDVMTSDFQVRIVHDDREASDSEWAVEVHNAWLRWKLGLGRHLRIGHFSPASGLEPVTDTHGTLLQTLAMEDVGFKHDWGAGFEGYVGALDYRLAVQAGSGMGFELNDGSHLLSARIGTPESKTVRWGLSVLQGRSRASSDRRLLPTPRYADVSVDRVRVGMDWRFPVGPLASSIEVSWGENESDEVLGAMAQLGLESLLGTRVGLHAQGRYWSDRPGHGENTRSQAAVVVDVPVSAASVVRFGYIADLSTMGELPHNRMVALQFYHLGL